MRVSVVVAGSRRAAAAAGAGSADVPVNPASLTKLLTTFAALDLLGPAWTWTTPVWLTGAVRRRRARRQSLVIKGSGDPKLVVERLWLLLRRRAAAGRARDPRRHRARPQRLRAAPRATRRLRRRAAAALQRAPDALLLNFKSVT